MRAMASNKRAAVAASVRENLRMARMGTSEDVGGVRAGAQNATKKNWRQPTGLHRIGQFRTENSRKERV